MASQDGGRRALVGIVTMLAAALLFYLAAYPLSLFGQGVLCWGLVLLFLLVRRRAFMQRPLFRLLFLLLTAFVSVRYLIWRSTDTLVYLTIWDFVPMALLFLAELQAALVHLLSLFANAWPLHRDESLPPWPEDLTTLPTIDVFIPTYSEAEELVRITVTAATQIAYPKEKLRVYILDDGGTDQRCEHPSLGVAARHRRKTLQAIADAVGATYLTRARNLDAKAGNINSALPRTQGELILMLDCDHVPSADFLQRTVGHFLKDAKLFLVQTPHFFINPDPVENNLGTFQTAPSENEMFYRSIQPAVDLWNASFFCGSAALLRRAPLEQVGGLSGISITEDAETSLLLHSQGWRSLFLARPMVCGLCPDTFGAFILQRSRWCQGMLQVSLLNNPLWIKGLTWAQRICYSGFSLYWFFGISRVLFFIAPTLYLLFGLRVYHVTSLQVFAYALPHLVASFLAVDFLFGKHRWPLFSELYESVQSIFMLPAVIEVLRNPHAPTFRVTPKGQHLDQDFLSPLARPFYALLILMFVALVVGVVSWFSTPWDRDVIAICVTWLLINMLIAFASLGSFWERHQVRHFPRALITSPLAIRVGPEHVYGGTMSDLSLSGVAVHLPPALPFNKGQKVQIESRASNGEVFSIAMHVMRVRHDEHGTHIGCESDDFELQFPQLVHWMYGDSERWVKFWQRPAQHPSVLQIIRHLFRMGWRGSHFGALGVQLLVLAHGRSLWQKITGGSVGKIKAGEGHATDTKTN